MQRTIQLYEQLSLFEASADFKRELADLSDYLKQTKANLDGQVSKLVASLHAQLTSEKLPNKTGFFTGIHQWWKNLWGGRDDKKNPYYWQNRIGALGRTDIDPPTVGEYRMLSDLATSLSEAIESNPQPLVTKILTQWSGKLRGVVAAYMDSMIDRVNRIAGGATGEPEKPFTPPTVPEKKGKEKKPLDPEAADRDATIAAWKSIEAIASEDEKAQFKVFADRKLWKDAIAFAQELLAKRGKTPSRVPSAPMADDDEEVPVPGKGDEDDTPAPPVKKSLDDEAADLGITPDMKTNLGGAFKSLPPALKKLVIDQCRKGMPECPVGKDEDDHILARLSTVEIHKILRKHEGKSVENIKKGDETIDDPQEREVLMAVHEPWLSLTAGERKYHNKQGSNGRPLKSHNRVINGLTYPFRIPPVLRKEDPRFHILQDYYPDHFRKLSIVGRVEKPDDTEDSIVRRINRNIRDGKESGEFSAEKGDGSVPVPVPETKPMPAEGRKKGGKSRVRNKAKMEKLDGDDSPEAIKDVIRDFPEDISRPILALAATNEGQAREVAAAWVRVKNDKHKDKQRELKKRFKELLDEEDWDAAATFGLEIDDDDEMREMLKGENFKPRQPTMLEALKTRLRLQREGKATAWEPMPKKVTPRTLIERLRRQSSKLYQES